MGNLGLEEPTFIDRDGKPYVSSQTIAIIGDNGVFLVQPRNWRERLSGDLNSSAPLVQEKVSESGRSYSNETSNPFRSLWGQKSSVNAMLKGAGISSPAQGVMAFTDPKFDYNVYGNTKGIKIVSDTYWDGELVNFVQFSNECSLSESEKRRVVSMLAGKREYQKEKIGHPKKKKKIGIFGKFIIAVCIIICLIAGWLLTQPKYSGMGGTADIALWISARNPYIITIHFKNTSVTQDYVLDWVDDSEAIITTDKGSYSSKVYSLNSGRIRGGKSGVIFLFVPEAKGDLETIEICNIQYLSSDGLPSGSAGYAVISITYD